MKNTDISKLNINIFKAALQNSLESAFESLASDVGDNLYSFERRQLGQNTHAEELMDKLAANLDELFTDQKNILINEMNETIDQSMHLQKNLYKQNFFKKD